MPDLTLESFYFCKSIESFSMKVGDYTVSHGPDRTGLYMYDWHCECKGFQFRGKCKHIEEAKKYLCGWDQFVDGGEPDSEGCCPRCGNHTSYRMVGV